MELSENNFLVTGKVRTSHGIKGYMKILSYSGDRDLFTRLERITFRCGEREFGKKIEDVRISGKDILIKLEGINSPEEAQQYKNCEILIPREMASKCSEGEFYNTDLIGCAVEKDGVHYGTVISVITNSSSDLLEVESPELTDKEKIKVFLVPFRKEFVGKVDVVKKEIELLDEWIAE
jgi:16S rRNA processing protein RimM